MLEIELQRVSGDLPEQTLQFKVTVKIFPTISGSEDSLFIHSPNRQKIYGLILGGEINPFGVKSGRA